MRTRTNDPVDGRRIQPTNESRDCERVRDQSYIKQYNLQTVMAILKRHQPISRTDIARMTGMSATSVTRIVSALLNHGLIYECSSVSQPEHKSGSSYVKRGRKAIYLRVQTDGLYSVGIHLDRSMVRLCVMDFSNRICYQAAALVDGDCTSERMAQKAKELFDRMPETAVADKSRINAVGVCLSGSVDKRTGEIRASRRMGWEKVQLKEVFERTFGMSVCVENEIKACLIGEKVRLDLRDEVDTVYLHIGSEIGVAVVSNGMIVRGKENEAGDIARISLKRNRCDRSDLLWMHLTEEGLLRRAQEYDPSVCTLDDICRYCAQGIEWAQEMIADFSYHLCTTVEIIDSLFDPEKIILGGSVMQKVRGSLTDDQIDQRICFVSEHEESCVSGAALIALRAAVIECIGQSAE